ncbi:MAG TPA: hypothetical protein VIZ59_01440 [Rubrobacteraceae bacterium]
MKEELPIACNLVGGEQDRRREAVSGLLNTSRRAGELEDGYQFAFPGDAGWAMRLVEFVVAERSCCPFFRFELVFEPGGGEILLRVRGPEGTKQFISDVFSLASSP